MTRRTFLAAVAAARARAQEKRPNVVILFTDDQRFDTIRAWGNQEIRTPAMDRLAAEGTSFTHAFTMGGTHGAICVPSRGMLMTGRSLYHVMRNLDALEPFPRKLAEAGYQTFMTGKWHNGPKFFAKTWTQDARDVFFGGMSDQFQVMVQDFDPEGEYAASRGRRKDGEFASTLFANAAIRFLETRDTSKPFLLYVPFTAPHDPRTAPTRFAEMYSPDKVKLPPNYLPRHPFDNGDLEVRDEKLAPFPRTEADTRKQIAEYYAMVSAVDHEIGRILDALEKSGDAANTYVFFAGDNGLAVGRHGLFGKQNLYDHSWRVPLIVRGPGVPKGKRVDSLVYIMDICPTVYKVTGVTAPAGIEAQELDWKGGGTAKRECVFAAYRNLQRAVRTERWKLIEYNVKGEFRTQLFDLKNDPWEMRDLAPKAHSENALGQKIYELRAMLRDQMKTVKDPVKDLGGAVWPER